jgi:hypothetical protein
MGQDEVSETTIARFSSWLGTELGLNLETYADLHAWSIRDLSGFWSAIARFFGVRMNGSQEPVLEGSVMPDVRWFPEATLNYAEHALRNTAGDLRAPTVPPDRRCRPSDRQRVATLGLAQLGRAARNGVRSARVCGRGVRRAAYD